MGTYLENYLESVSTLPQEVRRNFALLRELDARSQELIEKVDVQSKNYIKNAKRQRESNPEEEKGIKHDLNQCLELGDEKVQLAIQTYELVDKHIRRLDQDLKKFEAELQAEQLGGKGGKGGKGDFKKAKLDKKPAELPNGKAGGRKKAGAPEATVGAGVAALPPDARVLNVDIDMPIDPHEPTYCICNRVSFGEMVGCDNADCKVEWFHFECVGLTHPPKGKWFCPDCTAIMKKKQMYK